MNENKIQAITKIFNNDSIRTIWDSEEEKYYISVVDIVSVISGSKNPQVYWRVLKKRLKEEGNETVTNCNALKLKAYDGKYRFTDVTDIEGIFRIVESISSKNAEPIKQWLLSLVVNELMRLLIHHLRFKEQLIYIALKDMMRPGLLKE